LNVAVDGIRPVRKNLFLEFL